MSSFENFAVSTDAVVVFSAVHSARGGFLPSMTSDIGVSFLLCFSGSKPGNGVLCRLEDSAVSESSVSDFDRARSTLSKRAAVGLFAWSDNVFFSGDKDSFRRFANIPRGFFLVLE